MRELRYVFPDLEIQGYQFLSMVRRVVSSPLLNSGLERCDRIVLSRLPALERFVVTSCSPYGSHRLPHELARKPKPAEFECRPTSGDPHVHLLRVLSKAPAPVEGAEVPLACGFEADLIL